MITHGLRIGQQDDLLKIVNQLLVEKNLPPVSKQTVNYHLRRLSQKSNTLTGAIIKEEAKKLQQQNEQELKAITNNQQDQALGAH